jgi:hypothetical protein
VTRRTNYCHLWLWQISIYIIIMALKLLLSIPWAEYKTAAVGEWAISRRADIEDGIEVGYITLEEA